MRGIKKERRQEAEGGKKESEDRRQKTKVRRQKSEDRSQKTDAISFYPVRNNAPLLSSGVTFQINSGFRPVGGSTPEGGV